MFKASESDLIKKLEEGETLNIIFLSHHVYWKLIKKLEKFYKNCKVQVFGCRTAFLKMSPNQEIMEEPDLILFFGTEYNELEEKNLNKIASGIFNKKGKKVSIGYYYYIKKGKNVELQVKIINYQDGNKTEKCIDIDEFIFPLELAEYTFKEYNKINNLKKVKRK